MVSIDGGLLSDVVFSDSRGRRSSVQQIGGDAARQGRAVQRTEVSQIFFSFFLFFLFFLSEAQSECVAQ